MKAISRFWLVVGVLALAMGLAGDCLAQDPGNPDSVIIDLAGAKRYGNDSLVFAIIVRSDAVNLGAAYIPISYTAPDDYWDVDTAYFIGARWLAAEIKGFTKYPGVKEFAVYANAIFSVIPPGRDTMATVHLHKKDGAGTPAGSFYIDTTGGGTPPDEQFLLFVDETGLQSWVPKPVGTDGQGGYVDLPVSIPTDVQDITGETGVPRESSLLQNYPNPFNARTVIEFGVPHDGQVRLEVFNILGQRVATLVDQFLAAGMKRVDWNGTDASGRAVSSGMYFYRLTTADITLMKKMVLMK